MGIFMPSFSTGVWLQMVRDVKYGHKSEDGKLFKGESVLIKDNKYITNSEKTSVISVASPYIEMPFSDLQNLLLQIMKHNKLKQDKTTKEWYIKNKKCTKSSTSTLVTYGTQIGNCMKKFSKEEGVEGSDFKVINGFESAKECKALCTKFSE